MMKIRRTAALCLAGAGFWILLATGLAEAADEHLSRFEFLEIRMGIPVRILVYAPDSQSANEATTAAYQRIRQLDRILSDYDPDSELMQLTTNASVGEPHPVSQELWTVLEAAQALSEETDGAFDVTVGPVVKLWRRARQRKTLPTETDRQQALTHVSFSALQLNPDERTVTLLKPGMRLDLGAIAKGYAADEALRVLREHGLNRALIDAGGDMTVGDPPPDVPAWVIEVEKLRTQHADGDAAVFIELKNQAVATSGDAYQYLEFDGVRYSHIVDPKTGLGLTTPRSVSVIAPTGMAADALASAVSVLGPEQGLKLIETRAATDAYIAESNPQKQFQHFQSSGWSAHVIDWLRGSKE